MPNIRQNDAPSGLTLNPSSLGTDATAAAARRVGSFYNQEAGALSELGSRTAQLGSDQERALRSVGHGLSQGIEAAGDVAVKYLDHQEISHGSATGAQLLSDLNSKWNETIKNADPNDPSVAAKFRETVVEPSLAKFKEAFSTENSQKWAESYTERNRQHFFEKTSADMSTMAGVALKVNVEKTVNTLSSTVRNDPTSLDLALRTADSSIAALATSSPNIDGVMAAKVQGELGLHAKEAIVKSWFLGVAEKNPEAAVKALESGKYAEFIKGDEARTIIGYARTNARLAQSESRNARVMGDYVAKQEFHKAANDLELSTAPGSPGDRPVLPKDYWQKIREIGQMPGAQLEPGRLKSMVENGERITERLNKPEPLGRVSHDTTMGMLNRIRATDDSRLVNNDDIYKAYGEGKLNTGDFNFLVKEFKEQRTPEGEALSKDRAQFFKQYTGAIDSRYDPILGSPKLYAAEMDARRLEQELRKAGKDPHLAYDPSSEYFFGNPKRLQKFQGSMQGDLTDKAASPSSPAKVTEGNDTGPPAPLRDIAALEWSAKRQQYRDAASGKLYNRDGSEVKQ